MTFSALVRSELVPAVAEVLSGSAVKVSAGSPSEVTVKLRREEMSYLRVAVCVSVKMRVSESLRHS